MQHLIGCMYGHQADAGDEETMTAFGADDSPPCGECGAPTFIIGTAEDDG